MQLDECLSEKNKECQTLFASIQQIEQAKYWQEQLYNNAYNNYQSCKDRLISYEQEMLDMDNTISHLESNNKGLRAQIEQMEEERKSSAQSTGGRGLLKGIGEVLLAVMFLVHLLACAWMATGATPRLHGESKPSMVSS